MGWYAKGRCTPLTRLTILEHPRSHWTLEGDSALLEVPEDGSWDENWPTCRFLGWVDLMPCDALGFLCLVNRAISRAACPLYAFHWYFQVQRKTLWIFIRAGGWGIRICIWKVSYYEVNTLIIGHWDRIASTLWWRLTRGPMLYFPGLFNYIFNESTLLWNYQRP